LRVPDDRPAATRASPRVLLVLAAIVLAGTGLRVYRLGAESFWIDEFHSLAATSGRGTRELALTRGVVLRSPPSPIALRPRTSLWDVPTAAIGNPHPPLFFMVLRAWRVAFGDGETAVRLLPVLASVAAILVLFDAVLLLHGAPAALWAAALMAAAPMQVFYAREARGYSLALALALIALAALARIRLRGPRLHLVVLLGVTVLLSALVHYFAIGVLAGLGACAASSLRAAARRRALAAFVIAGALFLAAWGPFFWNMHRRSARGWVGFREPAAGLPGRSALRVASAPWHHLTASERHARPAWPFAAAAVVLVGVSLRARRDALPWVLWFAGAMGLLAAQDMVNATHQTSVVRFIYFASPATCALVALAPRALGRRAGHLLPAAGLLVALWHVPGVYRLRNPPWREMARAVDECLADADLLVLYATPDGITNAFRSLSHYGHLGGNAVLSLSDRLSPAAAAHLARSPAVCLVTGAPPAARLTALFPVATRRWVAPRKASLWRLERGPS
jgi:hypothetical protein